MKCTICNKGKLKSIKELMKEDNIEFYALECDKCKERIMTMPQLKYLADKYRKLRKTKDVKFAKWGNSIAVRIPVDIAEEFNIKSGRYGIITKDKEGIKIIPA